MGPQGTCFRDYSRPRPGGAVPHGCPLLLPVAGPRAGGGRVSSSMATTKLLLATGDQLEVEGSVEETIKELENSARSGAGTLALLRQAETGEPLAVNAAQVVTVRPGDE